MAYMIQESSAKGQDPLKGPLYRIWVFPENERPQYRLQTVGTSVKGWDLFKEPFFGVMWGHVRAVLS